MHLYFGMMVNLKDSYYITSNRESGYGRYDIMLEPVDKTNNAYIMEFKVFDKLDDEEEIKDTLENAKKQIEEMKYDNVLKEKGIKNIYKIVYAFNGKNVEIEVY